MDVVIEPCDPFTRLDEIYEVYALAQQGHYDEARGRGWRDEHLPRHATRTDFDFLVAARRDGGGLAGFAYGYTGEYGQWWTDRIASALSGDDRAAWLDPPTTRSPSCTSAPMPSARASARGSSRSCWTASPTTARC
jgi:hypothetical protein